MSKSSVSNIRVLIVDDHILFRESLARLLQAAPGFSIVGHCSHGSEAIQIVRSRHVDIILLDLDLGAERGEDFLQSLEKLPFHGKVLVVTAGVNDRDVPHLIRKGIAGIFMKHGSPALLLQGIRETMDGKVWFEQDLLRRSLEGMATGSPESSHVSFTSREKSVLSFVFEGLSNKQIADRIEVSESAVKSCLQHLFTKTGVRTRSQLVRVALEQHRDEL